MNRAGDFMVLRKAIQFETTFAVYTATELLGEGGSGRVFRVGDESGQEFALKLLDAAKATSDKRKRFKNELKFGTKNQHANVITVTDHGVHKDGNKAATFYVMPLYANSLRELLSKGISVENVLPYFSQILDGVEAARLQGVTHRDLKPENILYDASTDRLLVADFGIAHFEEEELATIVETAPNARLANFQYAAPEQRKRGLSADRRTDIYALGLMLNEMFTGEIPQGAGYRTIESVSTNHGYLDELVATMIQQAPANRPESIEIVKQQLIARRNEFVISQRVSELKQTVIPNTELDDPLILDPPYLVNVDYDRGNLILMLSQPVNNKWISALHNMGSYTSIMGRGPEAFSFNGNRATVSVSDHDAQRAIDYFKEWLPKANRQYEAVITREKQEAENQKRRALQSQAEAEERRLKMLKTLKF